MSTKSSKGESAKVALKAMVGELTLGRAVWSFRMTEEISQVDLAKKLGVSKAFLCDVEKGRRLVGPKAAALWARKLKESQAQYVRLALQDELRDAGLEFEVSISEAHA